MALSIRELLQEGSREAVASLLAESVVFHSPVADYGGRDDVAHLLATIARVLQDVRATHEWSDGTGVAIQFAGRVHGDVVEGMLVQRIDASGLVTEATLWLRPLAGLRRAVAQMREALAREPLPSGSTGLDSEHGRAAT
jgi:hypothetical protein